MFLKPDHFVRLCDFLGYKFKNPILLAQAITRETALRQGKQEKHIGHNATLATQGDGLLRAVIEDILKEIYSEINKGQLSQTRDSFVNNEKLAHIANQNNLWQYLIMADHEQNIKGRRKKVKILSDTLEAIIAAIFLDSNRNYQTIKTFIIKLWGFTKQYQVLFIKALNDNNLQGVKTCLECGADPNEFFIDNLFPLNEDSEDKSEPIQFPIFPLHKAETLENPEMLQLLLTNGAMPDCQNILNMTPLYNAACHGNIQLADILLRAGATYIQEFGTGYTPLHVAAFYGKTEMVEFLLQRNAEINKLDFFGTSALHAAASQGHTQTVACLLKMGADANIKSNNDKNDIVDTPLHRAASCLTPNGVIPLLIQNGADIDVQNHKGQTALHIATACQNKEAILDILRHKPKLNVRDNQGRHARDLTDDAEIIQLLQGATMQQFESKMPRNFGNSREILLSSSTSSPPLKAIEENTSKSLYQMCNLV